MGTEPAGSEAQAGGRGVSHVVALFVNPRGPYPKRLGTEFCWDELRDARRYHGPWPVIAHPPCSRWCRLAGLVEARWGHKKGDDGGCFASALAAVRAFGGVLEHPAYSAAWAAHGLSRPPTGGGWVDAGDGVGTTCYVEQGRYGHPAKKATWLYAVRVALPELRWGVMPDKKSTALVSWCGNHIKSGEKRPRVGKEVASRTPPEFLDELLAMARSVSL